MKTKLSLLTMLGCIVLAIGSCKPEEISIEKDYINLNHLVIDTSDVNFSFAEIITPEEIEKASIFFTAEVHGLAINKKLETLFLSYLVLNHDFNYILAELPLSHAEMLNKYLTENDVSILNEYFEYIKGTLGSMAENHLRWQDLCAFNETLPSHKKLKLIGVDLEFQPDFTIKWLQENYLKTDVPAAIKSDIDLLSSADFNNSSSAELFSICEIIKTGLNTKPSTYEQYLGQDYLNFKQIIESAVDAHLVYEKYPNRDIIPWNNYRDSVIAKNFLNQDKAIADGKYYGQWGNYHTFQSNTIGVNWFAATIQKTEKFKDKILTCQYIYRNSEARMKSGGTYSVNTYLRNELFSFNKYPVIINMMNNNSLYKNDLVKVCLELGDEQIGITTDYFQYFVLINEDKPTRFY